MRPPRTRSQTSSLRGLPGALLVEAGRSRRALRKPILPGVALPLLLVLPALVSLGFRRSRPTCWTLRWGGPLA